MHFLYKMHSMWQMISQNLTNIHTFTLGNVIILAQAIEEVCDGVCLATTGCLAYRGPDALYELYKHLIRHSTLLAVCCWWLIAS